jgi:hypothetical protein
MICEQITPRVMLFDVSISVFVSRNEMSSVLSLFVSSKFHSRIITPLMYDDDDDDDIVVFRDEIQN